LVTEKICYAAKYLINILAILCKAYLYKGAEKASYGVYAYTYFCTYVGTKYNFVNVLAVNALKFSDVYVIYLYSIVAF